MLFASLDRRSAQSRMLAALVASLSSQ